MEDVLTILELVNYIIKVMSSVTHPTLKMGIQIRLKREWKVKLPNFHGKDRIR